MNKLTLNRYLYKTNKDIIKKLNSILNKVNTIDITFILTDSNKLYFYFKYNSIDIKHTIIFYNHFNLNKQLLKYCLNNDKYFNVNIISFNDTDLLNFYIVYLNDYINLYDKSIKFKCIHFNNNFNEYCYLNEYFSYIYELFRFKNFYE